MTMKDILLAKEGRIGRKQFWMGTLVLLAIGLLVTIPLVLFLYIQGLTSLLLFGLIGLVFYYPTYCLYAKRRHDRNKSGLLVIIYLGLTLVNTLLSVLIVPSDPTAIETGFDNPLFWVRPVVYLVSGVFALYLLVVCGFLKGTDGPNQYGPDPLA